MTFYPSEVTPVRNGARAHARLVGRRRARARAVHVFGAAAFNGRLGQRAAGDVAVDHVEVKDDAARVGVTRTRFVVADARRAVRHTVLALGADARRTRPELGRRFRHLVDFVVEAAPAEKGERLHLNKELFIYNASKDSM